MARRKDQSGLRRGFYSTDRTNMDGLDLSALFVDKRKYPLGWMALAHPTYVVGKR